MLFEKSNGNIDGVLKLTETYSLNKIEKIYQFWVEITLPQELREKRMREEADKAAQGAADLLLGNQDSLTDSMTDERESELLSKFLDTYQKKA